MSIPFFYVPNLLETAITLPEETSKHIVQVLRMKMGDKIRVTDGKGGIATVMIDDDNRKRCTVKIIEKNGSSHPTSNVTIAISLIKNAARFEWFLEKATEVGVSGIIPLLCDRTETEKFRLDRLNAILISAMLQSQQVWLPNLCEPISLKKLLQQKRHDQKLIAHCLPEEKVQLTAISHSASSIILIGPEGDFTEREISSALDAGFQPVALGNTRLRTETAGIVAATLLCIRF